MPDTVDPELARQLLLREQMNRAPTGSPEQHTAAEQFQRAVLGTVPPPDWRERVFGPRTPYHNKWGEAVHFQENLDPQVEAAYLAAARSYPQAAREVTALSEIPDTAANEDTLGLFGNMSAGMGVRRTLSGKPRSFHDMIDTVKHELAHARGLPDEVSDRNRAVTAYDVGRAAHLHRLDTHLSAPPGAPVLRTGTKK